MRNTDAGLLLTETPLIVRNGPPITPLHRILVVGVFVRQLDHGTKMTLRVSHFLPRGGIVYKSLRQNKEASEEERFRKNVILESLRSMLVETVVLSLEQDLSLRRLPLSSIPHTYRQKLKGENDKLCGSARDELHRVDTFPSGKTEKNTEREEVQRRRTLDLEGLRRLEGRDRL